MLSPYSAYFFYTLSGDVVSELHFSQATPTNLEREYSITRQLGVCFGAKLVRGAYLARERQLAQQEGRASPVCDSYEETGANYTRLVGSRWLRGFLSVYLGFDSLGSRLVGNNGRSTFALAALGTG